MGSSALNAPAGCRHLPLVSIAVRQRLSVVTPSVGLSLLAFIVTPVWNVAHAVQEVQSPALEAQIGIGPLCPRTVEIGVDGVYVTPAR